MSAIIINLDDFRKEKEPDCPMEAALKAVKEYGERCSLKGIEDVDEYFKKYPFDFDDIPKTRHDA